MAELDPTSIKKIGLVARPGSNLDEQILKIKQILSAHGVALLPLRGSLREVESSPLVASSLDELFESCDLIISLGGDGTLISLCRKACEYGKAILGINAGKLGFLTDCKLAHAQAFFEDFFRGDFRVERPFMLDIILEDSSGRVMRKNAFNDMVIYREQMLSMADIKVFSGGRLFNQYFGDGLIIATPAGSTAYNLSANGPIIYTLAEVFVLTPVCSHSLTERSIVLPKGFEIELGAANCVLCIDGQESFKMDDFRRIKVKLSEQRVMLIHPKERDYFQTLKEKLKWGKFAQTSVVMDDDPQDSH